MSSRLAQVAISAVDPERVVAFWCAVLAWEVLEREDGVICLGPADGGPGIDVLPVAHAKTGHNRLHLDVRANGDRATELDRLLALGAMPVDVGQGPDVTWTVLADPEGNELCLL